MQNPFNEGIFFFFYGGYNCLNDDTAFLEMKHMANPLEHLSFNHIDSATGGTIVIRRVAGMALESNQIFNSFSYILALWK